MRSSLLSFSIVDNYECPSLNRVSFDEDSLRGALVTLRECCHGSPHPLQDTYHQNRLRISCVIAGYAARHFLEFSVQAQRELMGIIPSLRDRVQVHPPTHRCLSVLLEDLQAVEVDFVSDWALVMEEPLMESTDELEQLHYRYRLEEDQEPKSPALSSEDDEEECGLSPPPPDLSRQLLGPGDFLESEVTDTLYALLDKLVDEGFDSGRNQFFKGMKEFFLIFGKHWVSQVDTKKWLGGDLQEGHKKGARSEWVERLARIMSSFVLDYLLGVKKWKAHRLARSLERLAHTVAERICYRYLVPAFPKEALPMEEKEAKGVVEFVRRVNQFVSDYTQAFRYAQTEFSHFPQLCPEAQEALVVQRLNEILEKRGQSPLFGAPNVVTQGCHASRREQSQRDLLVPLIRRMLPSADSEAMEYVRPFLKDFPEALPELARVLLHSCLTPALLTKLLHRLLTLPFLPRPCGGPARRELCFPDELSQKMGEEIIALGTNLVQLGEPSGIVLRAALAFGEGVASFRKQKIGEAVFSQMANLWGDQNLEDWLCTAEELLWEEKEGTKNPSLAGVFELKSTEEEALKRKGEQQLKDSLINWVTRSETLKGQSTLQALLDTDEGRGLCERFAERSYALLWQPSVIKIAIYHYLLAG